MSIVVLNHMPSKIVNFKDWLEEAKETVEYIMPLKRQREFESLGYQNLHLVDNYFDDQSVLKILKKINSKSKISALIALDELDLERASLFREYFGIEGQKYGETIIFRNKYFMKLFALKSGIKIPKFTYSSPKHPLDLEFINSAKKYVLKDVDGTGSINIRVESGEEIVKKINMQEEKLIEEYIDIKNMYSVDGLILNGKVIFSCLHRYNQPTIDSNGEFTNNIVEIVSPDEPIYSEAMEFHNTLLPYYENFLFNGCYAFHTEIFHTTSNQFLLCELHCRCGGARISELIRQSYSISMEEIIVKYAAGIIDLENLHFPKIPNKLHAVFMPPKKRGEVLEFPDSLPFEWVVEYQSRVRKGKIVKSLNYSSDCAAFVIISGENKKNLWDRISELEEYFKETYKVKENNYE